jgi:hypothetical protein
VRILAQRATTKEWLHWDLPIAWDEIGWGLSQPGHVKGTVDPVVGSLKASDGRLLLDEWGTLLYFEDGGVIRWGGIVALSRPDGNQWVVEATGFGGYPHSRVYRGDYVRYQVDPATVIGDVWAHIQDRPNARLGVQVVGDSTPTRLGEYGYVLRDGQRLNWMVPHRQFQQLNELGWAAGAIYIPTTADDLVRWLVDDAGFGKSGWWLSYAGDTTEELSADEDALLSAGWAGGGIKASAISAAFASELQNAGWSTKVDGAADELWSPAQNGRVMVDGDQVVDPAPFRIKPWESQNCGKIIDDVTARGPLEWVERVLWDGETATPQIVVGYPRVGRRRDDLAFEMDVNVTALDYSGSLADDHANTVVATGAGAGGAMVRREVTREDGRLARDYVYSDQSVSDASVLGRIATAEARRRTTLGVTITGFTVRQHPHAPVGSWSVGDDVLVRAEIPYVGEVEQWVRIVSWMLRPDGSAVCTVQRSDGFLA